MSNVQITHLFGSIQFLFSFFVGQFSRWPKHRLNRPFPSFLLPLYQNDSKCKTIDMKMSSAYRFIFMQIKVIFISMVLHLDSFWNRGTRELRNGLLPGETLKFSYNCRTLPKHSFIFQQAECFTWKSFTFCRFFKVLTIKVPLWWSSQYLFFYIFVHNRSFLDILLNFNPLRTVELTVFGLLPKKHSNKFRTIFHLSFPKSLTSNIN